MKIKLNKTFARFKEGQIVNVKDVDGVPTEQYWRRRLRDSVFDNCCEIVKDEPTNVSSVDIEEGE